MHSSLREVVKDISTPDAARSQVLRMRFGIEMNTDHTLEEVGKQFDVTRERIRQIEAKALRKPIGLRSTGCKALTCCCPSGPSTWNRPCAPCLSWVLRAATTIPHQDRSLAPGGSCGCQRRPHWCRQYRGSGTDGSLSGRNTDGYGYIQSLLEAQPHWRADAGPITVVGAGGAARAVLVGLIDAGAINIRLTNRSDTKAVDMAQEFGGPVHAVPWQDRHDTLRDCSLLVNTTNQGMRAGAARCRIGDTDAEGWSQILSCAPTNAASGASPASRTHHRARTGHAGAPGARRV